MDFDDLLDALDVGGLLALREAIDARLAGLGDGEEGSGAGGGLDDLDAALASIKAEFDALDVGALAAEAEAECNAALAELLHPKACPWCSRPFDDSGAGDHKAGVVNGCSTTSKG